MKSFLSILICYFFLIISGLCSPTFIDSCEKLQIINNDLAGNYQLQGSVIDCTHHKHIPLGSLEAPFVGHLDGNNVPIKNLSINAPNEDYLGFFRVVGRHAHLENIVLENASIHGRNYVGMLAGARVFFENTASQFNDIHIQGKIHAQHYAGGLVGKIFHQGDFTPAPNAYFNHITINGLSMALQPYTSHRFLGGIIGDGQFVDIRNVQVNNFVITDSDTPCSSCGFMGGIAGALWGNVSHSHVQVDFTVSSASFVGGLVGDDNGKTLEIAHASSKGKIFSRDYSGGLLGNSWGEQASIQNSYSQTALIANPGARYRGGLVGTAFRATVIHSYAAGPIIPSEEPLVGGLIGPTHTSDVTDSFWDEESSGYSISWGGTASNTALMQAQSFYENHGWDFVSVWQTMRNAQYPQLR